MTEQDLIGLSLFEMQAMILPPDMPPLISMWPETVGWIWVGVTAAALFAIVLIKWRQFRKANAYRRAAVAALSAAGDDATAIAGILRRAALAAYPRDKVAALHGEAWLRFLDKTGAKAGFDTDTGHKMLRAPYRGEPMPVDGLNRLAVDWVRHHKVEVQP